MVITTEPKKYYEAQITLGFTPSDGDLIRGTINGVEVNGQWIGAEGQAILYRGGNANVPCCMIGFRNEKAVISLEQDSAPTTDYELHLYRYTPEGIVQIPPEYVEGLEETAMAASKALNTAESFSHTINGRYYGSYDRKTEGRDTFTFNAFHYYKISDFVIPYEEILDFAGTNVSNVDRSTVSNGENCVECGLFIVVNRAGECGLTIGTITKYFTAPSTGLYACYNGVTNDMTAFSYDFRFNVVEPIVTNPTTRKKYYMTVDDTGTLKATEVTT